MTFGRQVLVAVVVVPLVVGGCAGDPEPKVAPPEPSSPSSSSPAPSPEPKEAWEKKTDAGAVAFVEHWFEVFSLSVNAGDSSDLRAISIESCKTCAAIADRIDAIERAGGFYEGDPWRVLATGEVVETDGVTSMSVRLRYGAERFKESAGSKVVTNPAGRVSYDVRMRWSGSGWSMTELTVLS